MSPRAHHSLRAGIAAVLTSLTLWNGLGYLLAPAGWNSSGTYAVVRWFPGLRVVGLTESLVALALAFALARSWRRVERVLPLFIAVHLALCFSMLWSWTLVGVVAWGAPTQPAAYVAFGVLVLRDIRRERRRACNDRAAPVSAVR